MRDVCLLAWRSLSFHWLRNALLIGSLGGVVIGAIPGVGAAVAIAILLPAAGSFVGSGVLREQVCFHMCPYARFQSVMFDRDSLIISYDVDRGEPRGKRRKDADPASLGLGSCVDCMKCVHVCPTGIDIRNGLQYQCIGCAACIDACTDVMGRMGYGESLVRYSSENRDQGVERHWLRPRLVGYATLILVLVGLFGWVVTHRVPMGLTIVRDRNRLYRVDWDGNVENVYTLRISNRADESHQYAIEVDSPLDLVYDGPSTVEVAGGALAAVPVRLDLLGGEGVVTEGVDVVFRIRRLGDEGRPVVVEDVSRFHVPKEAR